MSTPDAMPVTQYLALTERQKDERRMTSPNSTPGNHIPSAREGADLLELARGNLSRRLHGLSKRTRTFTPRQLHHMDSLLDEFARKSKQLLTLESPGS